MYTNDKYFDICMKRPTTCMGQEDCYRPTYTYIMSALTENVVTLSFGVPHNQCNLSSKLLLIHIMSDKWFFLCNRYIIRCIGNAAELKM